MLSVGKTAKLLGISIRTLHYYDEINLVKPSYTAPSGYRYYDDDAVELLQQVIFLRELEIPVKQIKKYWAVRTATGSFCSKATDSFCLPAKHILKTSYH